MSNTPTDAFHLPLGRWEASLGLTRLLERSVSLQLAQATVNGLQHRHHFLIGILAFMASAMDKEARQDNKGQELQEFTLPVFHSGLGPVPDVSGGSKPHCSLTMHPAN